MKVIVESHIPYIKGRLEPFAEVQYLAAADITPEAVRDADALLVRTRTRCDARLLAGSRCSFIGTATIGTDHIDLTYCREHGITAVNAPGCNAPAVAQYVHSVIARHMQARGMTDCSQLTLGIVGVGHVGSIVERWARQLGFKVLLCDPPRARKEGAEAFVSLDTIAAHADIITFHTPLTRSGEDATYHLCDEAFIAKLSHCHLLINSARGEIADNDALVAALESGKIGDVAIDCWENEPGINRSLLQKSFVATPHIAGYSAEGKQRATAMVLEAMSRHFGWNIAIDRPTLPAEGAPMVTQSLIADSYDPLADTAMLRTDPTQFEALRNGYNLRHEVRTPCVCVFGASSAHIDPVYTDAAYRLGALLADAAVECVNGAGREGVMRAVTDGALSRGGTVTGIIPQFMVDNGWCYDRLTATIITPDMESRKALMEQRSDCIVAMPGGCGTLEELLQVITRRQLGLYTGEIVIFNVAGYFNPLLTMLDSCVERGFMHTSHRALWQVASTAEEVVAMATARHEAPTIESKYQ
ncbi:MAG: TIGR00730 family Rossman fold protein [Muribaculaceae bacterium]